VNEDELLSVPESQPWAAPEHDRKMFTPAQARKMDIFSFSMLCLWTIFEQYLSGFVPLPQEAKWAERYFQGIEGNDFGLRLLMDLKQEDKLVMLAGQLVMAEKDLDNDRKQVLTCFFSASLARNPNLRDANAIRSFDCLTPNQ
jgi:hypothetical protein